MADILTSCCISEDEKTSRQHSKYIDRQLAKEKIQFKRTVKILLLGSGESGKSTFLKQMRIIHGNDYDEEASKEFKTVIYGNIVKGMKVLIDARDKLHIPWGNEDNIVHAKFVFNYDNNTKLEDAVFAQFVPPMKELWTDSGILAAFDRRREFQLVRDIVNINISLIP